MGKKKNKSRNYGSKRKISPYLSEARYNNALAAQQAANEYRFYTKGEKIEKRYNKAIEDANKEIDNLLQTNDVEITDYDSILVKFVILKKKFEENLVKITSYLEEHKETMLPTDITSYEASINRNKSIIDNFKILFNPSSVLNLFNPINESSIDSVEDIINNHNETIEKEFSDQSKDLKIISYKEIYKKLLLMNNDSKKEDEPSNEDYELIRNSFLRLGSLITAGYYDLNNASNLFLIQRLMEEYQAITIPDKNLFNAFIKSFK